MTIQITPEILQSAMKMFQQFPQELLHSPMFRAYFATLRWKETGQTNRVHGTMDAGVMPGTVDHNRRDTPEEMQGARTRTGRLINPLASLDPIFQRPGKLKVLSIGPRTEMEIFHLMAAGFQLQNITAIDLVSPSPLIDTGDMHDLPYADQTFDVVISSWVISYSNRPQRAADEMLRVCKDGGFLAIGATHEPGQKQGDTDIVGSTFRYVEDFKRLLNGKFDRVFFQQEPESDNDKGAVMLIVRVRH